MGERQRSSSEKAQKKQPSAVVLASGGIDSTACIHMLQTRGLSVSALFIDFGQAASLQERFAVRRICKRFGVRLDQISVNSSRRYGPGELVGRNAFLIFSALMFARPTRGLIALGIHAGTPYYDCTEAFFRSISTLVEDHSNSQNQLLAPFLSWSKAEIVTYCRDEDVPLELTYSCERGAARPCGRCLSCRDRKALRVS